MTLRQHIVVDVSDETFITEPYDIDITGGIDISGLGKTIIRTDGTLEISDSIKLKHDSDNTVKLTPNNIDISGIGNISLDTIGDAVFSCNNNAENNNTVTISSETIIIDTCNNTGLHIKKQWRPDANVSTELSNNGDIIISDHGNCAPTGNLAGMIQFEASPHQEYAESDVQKCGQIALVHDGIVGVNTWGIGFSLKGQPAVDSDDVEYHEVLKLSGNNKISVCGGGKEQPQQQRNLDVSGSFRVANGNNYLNIDNTGDISSTGNLYIDKKIGIGTSTPESTLHIKSTTHDNPPNIKQSMNANTSNVYNYCEFTKPDESKTMGIEYDCYSGSPDTTTHMRMNILSNNGVQGTEIYNTGSTSYKNIMSILSSGEVGIGTTVPSNKLEVHGGPLGLALVDPTNYSNTTVNQRGVEYTTNNLLFKHDTHPWNVNYKYINTTAKISSIMEVVLSANDNGKTSMGFFTASGSDNNMSLTEKMRITSGGNVGIGTSAPVKRLEIFNSESAGHVNDSTSAQLRLSSTDSHHADIKNGPIDGGSNFALQFFVRDNHEGNQESQTKDKPRMTIRANGNVGIGTTNPTSKLTIGSGWDDGNKIYVNPSAGAETGLNTYAGIMIGGRVWDKVQRASNPWATINCSFNMHIDSQPGHHIYLNHYCEGDVILGGGGGDVHVYNDLYVNGGGAITGGLSCGTFSAASATINGNLTASSATINGHLAASSATITTLSSGTQISGSVLHAQLVIKNPGSHNHMGIRLGGYNHPSFGGDDSADAWIHAASGLCINAAFTGVGTNKRLFLNNTATGDIYIGGGGGDVHVYNSMKIAGSGQSHHDWYLYNHNGGNRWRGHSGGHSTGLYVTHAISCSQYFGNSDIRIKQDIKDVDDEEALTLLNRLSVKSYHYRDPVKRLRLPTIGFIAQECKEVLPNCIVIDKGFIPDLQFEIIKPAYDEDNILTIPEIILAENDTGTFKFLVTNSDVSGVSDISSTEILISCETDEAGLKTNKFKFEKPYDHVMVIGREINDFHSIDKNMIFALNFDATKFLHRLVLKEKKKTAVLEEDNATLKEQMATMQAQMATMEADMAIVKEKLGL